MGWKPPPFTAAWLIYSFAVSFAAAWLYRQINPPPTTVIVCFLKDEACEVRVSRSMEKQER